MTKQLNVVQEGEVSRDAIIKADRQASKEREAKTRVKYLWAL